MQTVASALTASGGRALHPALWTLIRLRYRARLRRTLREVRTLRGLAVHLAGLGIAALLLGPLLVGDSPLAQQNPQALLPIYQSGLLTIVLIGQIKALGERALYFAPSEVDFLFPAPFLRRELLAYRVFSGFSGLLLTAIVLSLVLVHVGGSWATALPGAFLSLLMVNLLTMCLAVVRETLEERAFSAGRRTMLFAIFALAAASIGYGLQAELSEGPAAVLRLTYETWGMQLLLLPFLPFAELTTATGPAAETIGWGAVCVLVNAALFAALMRLDVNYLETAAEVSRRLQARLQRVRAGRLRVGSAAARHQLRPLPRLRGAGTLAWIQLTRAMRGMQALGELALLVLVVSAGVYVTSIAGEPGGGDDLSLLAYLAFWTTVLSSYLLRFDFRAGVETIPNLKVLPLSGMAICAGQLVTPVLVTALFQLIFAAVPLRGGNYEPLLYTAVFALPVNTLWYAVENIAFLLYPIGLGGRGPGDFQFIGRQVLLLLAKLLVLGLCLALAIGAAASLFAFGSPDLTQLLAAVWLALALSAVAMVWVLARVFRRFDPSRHRAMT